MDHSNLEHQKEQTSVKDEIDHLAEKLTRLQHAYYVQAQPMVEDLEYDRLMDRLLALESLHPNLVLPDSPSARVGSDLDGDFPEFPHTVPVLSLDKAYTVAELLQWMEKCASKRAAETVFVIEEKIDGVSLVLYYEDGLLIRAVTRGNGFVGNEVTANVRTMPSVPLRLSRPETLAVRGEVYLRKSDFAALNRDSDTMYANPRNLAAGSLRRSKSSETATVPLRFYAYEGFWKDPKRQPATHVSVLDVLTELGFSVNPSTAVFSTRQMGLEPGLGLFSPTELSVGSAKRPLSQVRDYVDQCKATREALDHEIDGLVAKIDDLSYRNELGYTGHHPRWAIALKFDAPQAQTLVTDIDIQIGRTGRITPVARTKPVKVGGSVVSNVTLHNQDYIDMLELAVGDTVAISKRGDVIPAVERVIEKNPGGHATWRLPSRCPSCDTGLIVRGAHAFCPNPSCPAQVLARLSFFVGKDQMDIEGFGPETVAFLVERSLVSDVQDIYAIDWDTLVGEPGFGERKAGLLKQSVDASRSKPFGKVLVSLGIDDIGKKAVQLLIGHGIRSMDALLDIIDSEKADSLLDIKGFGEKTVASLVLKLSDPVMRKRIAALRAAGLSMMEPEPSASLHRNAAEQVFEGQTWCVTGSFMHFSPRSLALEHIEARGGRTVSSVTGKTTHVLAGLGAGSKLEQAKKLGITIIDEAEFLDMLQPKESDEAIGED